MTTVITREQGYPGLSVEIVRITTTSTLTQVTTAGWYNNSPISGESISPVDLVAICYAYGSANQATGIFNVSISNGILTFSLDSSNVVLPTIANHIATYANTSGKLSEDPATAISGGNIQAGLSGTAGTLASFPGAAAKGSFVMKAVANTGNTITTLSNDAMGQASVINIPDPGNAIGQLLIGATATPLVSGNFPENSGTAGLVVDSGLAVSAVSAAITQLGILYQVSVTLLTAQMVTAYDTPVVLIPAVSGKVIQIISASVYTASTGHTAYATGTAPIIQYGTTVHGGGTLATGAGLVAGDITAASSQVRTLPGIATSALTGVTDVGIYFSNATGDYTAGTGTNVTFNFVYMLLAATV